MFELNTFLAGGLVLLVSACLVWLISIVKHDVSIVDSFWSVMFVLVFFMYSWSAPHVDLRGIVTGILLLVWAARLSMYITWRNWGDNEDHRYRAIRQKYEPHFWLKSLLIIFIFQAVLAWIVSLPLLAILTATSKVGIFDYIAMAMIIFGISFESIADWQLHRFKSQPDNHGKVLNQGLWRYSRHPNYFGEFCVWWGFYFLALAGGGWWSVISPLLMTFLLLKFSGVALLESNIGQRRPKYSEYVRSTNAFFPGPQRTVRLGGGSL